LGTPAHIRILLFKRPSNSETILDKAYFSRPVNNSASTGFRLGLERKTAVKKISAVISVLALLVLVCSASTLTAQATSTDAAPSIAWQHEFMGGEGYSIYTLPNGGFVFNVANDSATLLVKVDSSGNLESSKIIQIGQEAVVNLTYFVPTSDGGYAFAGVNWNKYALVKTDADGNVMWNTTYTSDLSITYQRAMIQDSDGGFALAGFGQLTLEGIGWSWFARTDAQGKLLWNETLPGATNDCPSAIIQTSDGFILSDVVFSLDPNQSFFRLLKIDQNGNLLLNQTYGDEGNTDTYSIPECNTAATTSDGGYLLGGFLAGRNAWAVKTDSAGKMLWNQTYGGKNDAVVCIHQTVDGGFIMAAVQNASEAWIFKTDSAGNMIWKTNFAAVTFAGKLEANYNCVLQADDGGYIVLGAKDGNVWLAKINPEANPWAQAAIAVVIVAVLVTVTFWLLKRRKRKIVNA
jgi:hypothetical protein